MEIISNLALGFEIALSPSTLFYCFIGVLIGTFIGVLPGLGPTMTIGMLLPITFHLPPTEAIIMLAGIYYGAMYGGSTCAILLKLPGTASAAVVCQDGNAMARQGRGGVALVMTALASFVGSCFAILLLAAFAPPLAEFALRFGPPEYVSLMVVGLLLAAVMGGGTVLKGLGMVLLGLLLGMVGQDVVTGVPRYTFGFLQLYEGVDIAITVIGLFGIAELARTSVRTNHRPAGQAAPIGKLTWRELLPGRSDFRTAAGPTVRGTMLGSLLGILPGAGPALSSFMAYAAEIRLSSTPERFGLGAIEGITAPEAANNASAQTSFIPAFSLGIPGDAITAVILGGMLIHGLVPGPQLISSNPTFFWAVVASFWIGNLLLLIINIPFVGIWVKLLQIPHRFLFCGIMAFVAVGVFSIRGEPFDILLVLALGVIGFLFLYLGLEATPLLLGLVLGPMLEASFRRSMLLSRGDPSIFVTRPVSLVLLTFMLAIIVLLVTSALRGRRRAQRGNSLGAETEQKRQPL